MFQLNFANMSSQHTMDHGLDTPSCKIRRPMKFYGSVHMTYLCYHHFTKSADIRPVCVTIYVLFP